MAKTKSQKTSPEFSELLPKELRESVSDESLKAIEEAFNSMVERRVEERVELAVKTAEEALKESFDKDVNKLTVKMDEYYTLRAAKAFKVVNERHASKVNSLKEKAKKALEKQKANLLSEAKDFKEVLVENMQKFLKNKVENIIPQNELVESVRNNAAIKTLKLISKLVGVTPAAINENVRKGILEANEMLNEQKEIIQSHSSKEKELNEQIRSLQTKQKLYEMTEKLSERDRNFMRKIFADKAESGDIEYIQNHLNEALHRYRVAQQKETDALRTKTVEAARNRIPQTPRKQILENVSKQRPNSKPEKSDIEMLQEAIIFDAENAY